MAGIDPKFYYLTLGLLALCTLVGLTVAYKLQRDVNVDDAPPTEKDLLGPLEKAYYSGLMRDEEFRRIQESMARLKGDVAPPSKSSRPKVKPAEVAGPIMTAGPTTESGPDPGAGDAHGGGDHPPITPTGDSGPDHAPG